MNKSILLCAGALTVAALPVTLWAAVAPAGFHWFPGYSAALQSTDDGKVLLRGAGGTGWLWTHGMSPTRINDANGASSISADGTTVAGRGPGGAYVLRIGSAPVSLPALPGTSNPIPVAVSANGSTVVGQSGFKSFRYTAAEGMQPLSMPPGVSSMVAMDVSRDGTTVIGRAGDGRPFISTQGGSLQFLPIQTGFSVSDFRGLSADGSTVIGSSTVDGGGGGWPIGFAFRWTATGGYESLGSLPNEQPYSSNQRLSALSCNADASLIGGTQGDRRAWIWDAAHGMRDLRDVLITDYGFDLSNLRLESVEYISPDGRYLMGIGQTGAPGGDGGGTSTAWVAVIPSPGPASAWLVAIGIAAVRRRRVA